MPLKSGYRLVFIVNTYRFPVSGSAVYPEDSFDQHTPCPCRSDSHAWQNMGCRTACTDPAMSTAVLGLEGYPVISPGLANDLTHTLAKTHSRSYSQHACMKDNVRKPLTKITQPIPSNQLRPANNLRKRPHDLLDALPHHDPFFQSSPILRISLELTPWLIIMPVEIPRAIRVRRVIYRICRWSVICPFNTFFRTGSHDQIWCVLV